MGKADGRPWSSKSNRQRVSPATLSATLSLLECLLMETLPPHPRQTGWGGSLSGKSGLGPVIRHHACCIHRESVVHHLLPTPMRVTLDRPFDPAPTTESLLGCLPRAPMGTPNDGSNTRLPPKGAHGHARRWKQHSPPTPSIGVGGFPQW